MEMKSEEAYAISGQAVIETQFGSFSLADPKFDIRDIAGGLSRKCRFNGQCSTFYNVAEHSLLVARIMRLLRLGDPREGQLHDGNEAYLPDVPSPYKQLLPDLRALENRVDGELRLAFDLPAQKTSGCSQADTLALLIEAHDLLPSRGTGPLWTALEPYREEAMRVYRLPGIAVRCLRPEQAEQEFLNMYEDLFS